MVAISMRRHRCVECPSWRFCCVNGRYMWGKCGHPWSKFYKKKVEAQDSQCGYMLRGVRGRGEGVRYKVEQRAAREYRVEHEGMMRTEREEMEAALRARGGEPGMVGMSKEDWDRLEWVMMTMGKRIIQIVGHLPQQKSVVSNIRTNMTGWEHCFAINGVEWGTYQPEGPACRLLVRR